MRAFPGMTERDMGDLFRQPDGTAHMRAEHGMAQRQLTSLVRIALPALEIARIELPRLSDVVNEGAGQDDVTVDSHLRKRRLELVDNFCGQVRHPAQVIGLITALEREHAGIALTRDVPDSLKARLAQSVRPRLNRLSS